MQTYKLEMPKSILAGEDAIKKIDRLIQDKYKKVTIFTSDPIIESGVVRLVEEELKKLNISYELIKEIAVEPSYIEAQKVIDEFKAHKSDLIIAIGGGSVIDTAKLASLLSTEDLLVKDLLENPLLAKKQVHSLIIPTTAGTGAEATPNAIVAVPEEELKVGIVNAEMIPDYVILDPITLKSLPKQVAAATGIDTMCHAIECITSNKANPLSDTFAYRSMDLVLKNIQNSYNNKDDMDAKSKMLLSSFYGGISITASGTTGVHALSYPLGGKYHIAHGVSNAILLMPVMRFNEDVCRNDLVKVYDYCYQDGLNLSDKEKSQRLLDVMENIVKDLEIPTSLKDFNVDTDDLEELVEASMKVTRLLNNNKKEIKAEDAREIYKQVI